MRGCIIEGCDKPHDSHGMCGMHATRVARYGDPFAHPRTERPETCTVVGCDRNHYGRGLCSTHWMRVRSHGTVGLVGPWYAKAHLREREARIVGLLRSGAFLNDIARRADVSATAVRKTATRFGIHVAEQRGRPTTCVVCLHPESDELDTVLRSYRPNARSPAIRLVATRTGAHPEQVRYHLRRHLDNEDYARRLALAAIRRLAGLHDTVPCSIDSAPPVSRVDT